MGEGQYLIEEERGHRRLTKLLDRRQAEFLTKAFVCALQPAREPDFGTQ